MGSRATEQGIFDRVGTTNEMLEELVVEQHEMLEKLIAEQHEMLEKLIAEQHETNRLMARLACLLVAVRSPDRRELAEAY